MECILRQYIESDFDEVQKLHVEALKSANIYIDDPEVRKVVDVDLQNIHEYYLSNNGEFIVAVSENKIVGMGGIRKANDLIAEVKRMRVYPMFQGKGIGGKILDYLIQKSKKLGYKKLLLDVAASQKTAQRLYESRGFTKFKEGEIFGQETYYYERIISGE